MIDHVFTAQLRFVAQLTRVFCSDNSDTPPGAAENRITKPFSGIASSGFVVV